jgi:lipoprotein-anchoring transpeptidase ErfK/SrfK
MLVSAGKWAPTPTGDFRIWIKLRYTLMHGGSKELHTYYYLPNVPYTQYFYKGFGLHGAYWHNNFGQPMSHGCVNLSIPDAEKLFYWTSPVLPEGKNQVTPTKDNPGTRVVIHT